MNYNFMSNDSRFGGKQCHLISYILNVSIVTISF